MRRGLGIWIFVIISALILYLFSNETVTLALLLALIAVLPASFMLLKLNRRSLEVSLSDAIRLENKSIFTLTIRNKGWLPVASAEIEVSCENLRTGETDLHLVRRGLMPRKSAEVKIEVSPTHAGRYELSIAEGRMYDPLGIWADAIDCEDHRYMTSLPLIYEMHIKPVSSAAMPESDIYAVRRKGSVSGDMVGIKEYVAGDPVRNIHWKLSEKTDKLLVKELGEPATDNYLLLLDSAASVVQDTAALDAIASVFASLMHSLRLSEIAFNVGWTDPATDKVVIYHVVTEDDYNNAIDSFLAVPVSAPSAFSKIESDISENRYARVIIVGPRIPADIENLTNGCEATVLMYGGGSGLSSTGVSVLGFDSYSYKESLSMVEL